MRPKFEVGEVVILVSQASPESNGEYTVLERHEGEWRTIVDDTYVGYKYIMTDGYGGGWVESSLRKKHTPGEMSFDNLMQSLSSPKLLTHQPQ